MHLGITEQSDHLMNALPFKVAGTLTRLFARKVAPSLLFFSFAARQLEPYLNPRHAYESEQQAHQRQIFAAFGVVSASVITFLLLQQSTTDMPQQFLAIAENPSLLMGPQMLAKIHVPELWTINSDQIIHGLQYDYDLLKHKMFAVLAAATLGVASFFGLQSQTHQPARALALKPRL